MKIVLSAYQALREWCDPGMEGDPYEKPSLSHQVGHSRRRAKNKTWIRRRLARLSL